MEEGYHTPGAGDHVLKTPVWIFAIRIAQVAISIIILGLSASLLSAYYFDEDALGVAVAVITWIALAYIIITEKIRSATRGYHILAVAILDGVLLVLWLATWANAAAERSSLHLTTYDYCYGYDCYRKRDVMNTHSKRATSAQSYLDQLAAVAGIGALEWILFVITFVWTIVMYVRGYKQGRFPFKSAPSTSTTTSHQMETKVQPQPQGTYQDPNHGMVQPGHMAHPQAQYPQEQYPQQGQYPASQMSPPPNGEYAQQHPVQQMPQQHYQQQPYYPEQGGYQQPTVSSGHASPYPEHSAVSGGSELDSHVHNGPPQHGQPDHGELPAQNHQY